MSGDNGGYPAGGGGGAGIYHANRIKDTLAEAAAAAARTLSGHKGDRL